MKLATILVLGSLAIGSAARADQPGPDWMPMEQVKAKVMESGYSQVTKLEADDGQWEGEGIKNGQKMASELDYVPLPDAVVKMIAEEWRAQVKDAGGKALWN